MTEHIHPIRHSTIKRFHPEAKARDAIRVYRCSPEGVCLQIRGTKQFASVEISFDLARQIAADLLQEADHA